MLPIAIAGMICTSPGQTYCSSVFNDSLRADLGISLAELTGAYMIGTLIACLPISWIGAAIDRFGARAATAVIVVMVAVACLTAAAAQGFFSLLLAYVLLRMFGQGALSLAAANTTALWFHRRLGTVSGIASIGMAAAMGAVPSLTALLIDHLGWRAAYVVLGLGVAAIMLPLLAFFYVNHPADVGQGVDGDAQRSRPMRDSKTEAPQPARLPITYVGPQFTLRQAMRRRSYWIASGAIGSWALVGTAIFFNLQPLFVERGLDPRRVAPLFATFAVCMALSQLVAGPLADRVPLNWLLAGGLAGVWTGLTLLLDFHSVPIAHAAMVLFGLSQGLIMIVGNTIWPRYFGTRHLGKIRGSVMTSMVAATSIGPFVMGGLLDWTGSFAPSLWLFLGLTAPLIVVALFATPPGDVK